MKIEIGILASLALLTACGSDQGAAPASSENGSAGPAATAGNDSEGPDTSGLADIVLGKINADPMRQEMKVTGKLTEFSIVAVKTESYGNEGGAVVECAGVVVFDGDVQWNYQDSAPRKAGEPAKFECQAEYQNQGNGWQLFGPMGIYPL